MIPRVICNPVVSLLMVITAILGYAHSSAHAKESRIAGMVTPNLIFSTYLGGKTPCKSCNGIAHTFAQNAAADWEGNTYVTGATTVSDLPVLNAWQKQPATGSTTSAFVAKYSPAGKLLWCTYLGGNNQSVGVGAAVMPDGGVAVAGLTNSDANGPFPTTSDPFQAENNGKTDYFVTVFDRSGKVRYSTYLGGSDSEGDPDAPFADDANNGNNIAADAHGLVYVTGYTDSGGGSNAIKFPVTPNAIQEDLKGGKDAFLSILDPRKSGPDSLVYSSFLGGKGDDKGHGVAVNARGSLITVVGFTASSDFPTTANAYRSYPAPSGFTSNGFVAQFRSSRPGYSSSRYTVRYSTYLGADSNEARDDTYGVALDPWGLIVVTGRTQSADFPMNLNALSIYNSAPYLEPGVSNDEPYLVKIDPSLKGAASLAYSTFLGGGSTTGGGGAWCTSVAVNFEGMAYVGGETSDTKGIEYTPSSHPVEAPQEFPYTEDALFTAPQGNTDVLFMQITPRGSTLHYSTFFGGTDSDRTYGLAVDPGGHPVLTGLTFSSDFPLKNPAQTWPGNTGEQNAFVARFSSSWRR